MRWPRGLVARHVTLWLLGSALSGIAVPRATGGEVLLAQPDPEKRGGAQQKLEVPERPPAPPPGSRGLPTRSSPPPPSRCPDLETIRTTDARKTKFVEALRRDHSDAVSCDSLTAVVAMLIGQATVAGRKVERIQPLNVQQARAELRDVARRPVLRAQLDRAAIDAGPDDWLRLVYEAALLDEHGLHRARDQKLLEVLRSLE